MFGRKTRLKTNAQVIARVGRHARQHLTIAFIVDDNLIGNKVKVKEVTAGHREPGKRARATRSRSSPKSLNLAEDDELMG